MSKYDVEVIKNPCKECGQDLDWLKESDGLHKKNKLYVKMAKDYCEQHEFMYSPDKCKPVWCKKCGYLEIYRVII